MQGGFTEKTELKVLGRATGVHGGVKDKEKKIRKLIWLPPPGWKVPDP